MRTDQGTRTLFRTAELRNARSWGAASNVVSVGLAVAVGVAALPSRAGAHHQVGISFRSSAVPVAENGGTYVQTVVLNSVPTATVTVEFVSGDTSVVTVSPTTLTFTPDEWNVTQEVVFTGVDDDVLNQPFRQTAVTVTASGGGYDGFSHTVTAAAWDDEPLRFTVREGFTYSLAMGVLVTQDCTPLVMGFVASDPAIVGFDPPELSWTEEDAGARKPVRISFRQNRLVGDRTVTVSRPIDQPCGVDIPYRDIIFTVLDDDAGQPMTLTLIAHGTPAEGGSDAVVTAQTSHPAPAGGTEVTLAVDPESTATRGSDFTLSADRLRIPEGRYQVHFTIHVIDDAVDDDDEVVFLFGHSKNPELSSTGIGLSILDNDDGRGDPDPGEPDDDEDEEPDENEDEKPDENEDEPGTAEVEDLLHVAPYWRGGGGFAVRPADGRSALVRLQCGQSNYESREFAGDDGLIVRLVRVETCVGREGELTFQGIDDDGWYWINGDYNAALAPLVRESSLRPELRPPIPDGVTASPSGDRRFVLSVTGRLHGTLVEHEANGFIGIIPHLVDLEGAGRHAAPFWRGHGGVVGKPIDGVSATFRLTCADGRSSTHELEPHPDGFIAQLLDGCFDAAGEPIDGQLEADGLEDGAWYWLNHGRLFTGEIIPGKRPCRPGRCSAAGPLVRRDPDSDSLTRPVVPGGVTADQGPLGTLFTQGKRFGIVTSWEPIQ